MNEAPTSKAHRLLTRVIKPGDLVVDATAGNGYDTCFLAACVGEQGRVVAFDTQPPAIESTRRRLEINGYLAWVELRQQSHEQMLSAVGAENAKAVMFNLGYLPRGDHSIVTEADTTVSALIAAMETLQIGGLCSVICYQGHPTGAEETRRVVALLESYSAAGTIDLAIDVAPKSDAPFLMIATKLRVPCRQMSY